MKKSKKTMPMSRLHRTDGTYIRIDHINNWFLRDLKKVEAMKRWKGKDKITQGQQHRADGYILAMRELGKFCKEEHDTGKMIFKERTIKFNADHKKVLDGLLLAGLGIVVVVVVVIVLMKVL